MTQVNGKQNASQKLINTINRYKVTMDNLSQSMMPIALMSGLTKIRKRWKKPRRHWQRCENAGK